ncbi:carbohydrate esterase family 4 protein [Leucosporidium creatinivorum]|uniref:Carbohydrate esterase family 4 protein n=1 Tax=Leucosporidium creatinivorum TaxID=106004 RepID=A0A1Y2G0S5_9BASI|nr:carbohydrate esterase family 4 protein [Leucosporidium creatinivorum]
MATTNSYEYSPRDLVGYGEHVPSANWPNGAKVAISLVLNYEEGCELAPSNGDTITETGCSEIGPGLKPMQNQRDVNMESVYEYGSRSGVWRIFRLFSEQGVPCTAYACGKALELAPKVAEGFAKGGHEVASHGYRWVDRTQQSAEEELENVKKAIHAIKATSPTGVPPVGWYYGHIESEAGARSRGLVARGFKEEGIPLKYYSDDYSDDLPHWVPYPGGKPEEGLLIIPYSLDCNDYKFAQINGFITGDEFAEYLIATFDELHREGEAGSPKMMSIGLHCRVIGRPGRIGGLRKFIEHAKSKGGWFTTREAIADHWVKEHPYEPQA